MTYKLYTVCNVCDTVLCGADLNPTDKKYYMHRLISCCPTCGSSNNKWFIRVARKIDTSKWYLPHTWGDRHYEFLEDHNKKGNGNAN